MKRLLIASLLSGVILVPAIASAQPDGEMLFEQGCRAFDLEEDLGSFGTPLGQKGRWLFSDLRSGDQFVYAFETIDLVPLPTDPGEFAGTTFVAWKFEGTGMKGTNRTEYFGTMDEAYNFVSFFEGQTFRGTQYKSGGISGSASGSFIGAWAYDAVRIVLCKAGFGG